MIVKRKIESHIEKIFWEAWSAKPPFPLVPQYQIKKYYVDFAYLEMKLIIELDGHATHSTPKAIAYDRKRARDIENEGWKIIRFGGVEINNDIQLVIKEIINIVMQECLVKSQIMGRITNANLLSKYYQSV